MKSYVFSEGMDWRRLGYILHNSSTNYRQVIEDNPQWSMDYLPPIGAPMIHRPRLGRPTSVTQEDYPFSSTEEYDKALNRYTPEALLSVETLNGYSIDGIQATTGLQ